VNTTAKIIVPTNPIIVQNLLPFNNAWCPKVINAPLDTNKKVFNNGIA
jgi:hypothetical protein